MGQLPRVDSSAGYFHALAYSNYVSTLRSIIAAMRGKLESRAVLPEGQSKIDQFKEVCRLAPKGSLTGAE